ncbi:MAG: AraC family transcriptional regulator [Xylanivirga thermophila]|uniref:AraC family transcriptional regulator n=1 Tax=Xylanivirga thermophila TaxID=2496273 RepID=UPI0039F4E3F4
MNSQTYNTLEGCTIFRESELVYINKSTELEKYCGIMHKHDFIEIAYVISGNGIHIIGDYEYKVSEGDLFIINYDMEHGFFSDPNSKKVPIVYNCAFMPEFLDASLLETKHFENITSSFLFKSLFPDDYAPSPDLHLKGAAFNEIGGIFSKMYSEYNLRQKGYMDIIRAYLIELIIKIFRYIDNEDKKHISLKNKKIVESAIEYLKENYNSDVKLEDLAMKSFISKNYFSTLFKETTGINFSDFVQKLRIDEACKLLKTTDMKVIDIAHEVGFNDIKFFYEVFKRVTSQTPGSYRNSH